MQAAQPHRFYMAGASLTEVLVVAAIATSLLGAGLPSFQGMLTALRIRQAATSFYYDLVLAKSEAIKRNTRVAICKSAEGLRCAAEGGWEHGWIVFVDQDNSGTREASETILKLVVIATPALTIRGNGNVNRYVSFGALGTSKLINGAFQAGTFTLCPLVEAPQQVPKRVVVNSTGKLRIADAPASVCQ